MIDIKQEELDKRFVDGVLAVESLVGRMKVLNASQFDAFCKTVHELLHEEIGADRLAAIQGKDEVRT